MKGKIGNVLNTFQTLYFQSRSLRRCSRRVLSLDAFLADNSAQPACQPADGSVSVDLGSGLHPKNPFNATSVLGVDLRAEASSNILAADLCFGGIPLEDSAVDFVTAFDFIEHVPRVVRVESRTVYPFIQLMNEIYRVLKPHGLFLSSTPAYPSKQAFQDPTHVNMITEDTFPLYFCSRSHSQGDLMARMYGFDGDFQVVDQAWVHDAWLVTIMQSQKTVSI